MILNFKKFGEGPPLIVLHGVFGSLDNWMTVGKELAKNFTVYLVDQRNHGSSFHSEVFDYEHMQNDLLKLLKSENISKCHLLGHSMGGKVAMNFACNYPQKLDKLVVVDIAPRSYPPHHHDIFEGFKSIKLASLTSRKEADDQLSSKIGNPGVRQFILKNLQRTPQGFQWKINLKAIEQNAKEIGKALEPDARFEEETLFIRGSESDYIVESDKESITKHFPKFRLETVQGAGHWVHAQKPKELIHLLNNFLELK